MLHVLELLEFAGTHQRHTQALARATGEHFNIFNILGVGHLEVKTHSPILGNLLNPKGKHGQETTFLRLFLAQFKIDGFNAETAKMTLEYYIGPKTENSGGRLDIIVSDGERSIIIENKIGDLDQEKQMERYRKRYPKANLFYLTPEGKKPSNCSEDDVKRIQFECISYRKDILTWLKECRKEAACLPAVRETITQYIHLIEELTGLSTTTHMNKELINKIVYNKENLAAFFELCGEFDSVRAELVARLDAKLDEIAKDNGLKREEPLSKLKENGSFFTTQGLNQRNLRIGFKFDTGNYRNFFFGFATKDPSKSCSVKAELLSAFEKEFNPDTPNDWWPASAYWEERYRDSGQEAFEEIRSGRFEEDFKLKMKTLAEIARKVCPDEAII
jgi:hypothetical protein